MNASARYAENLSQERSLADFIPYSSHIAVDTLLTKAGDLIRMWRLDGLGFETSDIEDVIVRKEQLNTLLRSIGSDHVSIWTHTLKRRKSDRLECTFDSKYSTEYHERYSSSFDDYQMMGTDLYLTLVYRPIPSTAGRLFKRAARRSVAEIRTDREKALRKFDQLSQQVDVGMKPYHIQALTTFENDSGATCSRPLALLNYLITGDWQDVRLPRTPLNEYLGNAWLHMGTETIQIQAPSRTRFAQAISLKEYDDSTQPGVLNGLLYVDFEYTMTQSFSFLAKATGLETLRRQKIQLRNTEDGSDTQIAELDEVVDGLTAGKFSMGEYHYTLMVYGESVEEVRSNTSEALTILKNANYIPALEGTATDAAWFAQLPGNWSYRPRIAHLTTKNFASLACFHNFTSGKRNGNPWGTALTMFKTPSGQPLYANFHYATGDEVQFGNKLLGNTAIVGQSGQGKSVLLNHLLIESQQYKPTAPHGFTTIFFDHREGSKICIKAMGGKYQSIKTGELTGFNPFQIKPTNVNLLFLERLVRVLSTAEGEKQPPAEEIQIADAVRTVMGMPKEYRSLSYLLQSLPEADTERHNSLSKRLSKWCRDDGEGRAGSLSWALDCPTDKINLDTHAVHGFDGTAFLDIPEICAPISMYLLHRMKSEIDGRRFIYFMDEFSRWIGHSAFSDFVGEEQVSIRKMDGLGVFATQMPKQVLGSPIAAEMVEQMATSIYLPNPRAERKDYIEGFMLTEAEFEAIRNFPEESRLFLLKQGSRSMIARLDLTGMDDDLAVLSGTANTNALLDEITSEVGNDPDVWLPIFHQRRQEISDESA